MTDLTTGTGRTADEARIRELLADRAAATAERDARRFLAYCAPEIVTFGLAPPLRCTGPEALDQEAVEACYATWQGPVEVTPTRVEVAVGDGVAFAHGINRMHGTKKDGTPEGREVELWFRATVGLRKTGGVRRITHVHESVPFLMDGSGLAALGLKP
ncbi:YybH family protein [Streptomyces chattanoogensis]|uniref:YybH family protein n=1 Tax=Streptomyces chattanoogensis TaxID=66876 RepID=UPI00368FBF7D